MGCSDVLSDTFGHMHNVRHADHDGIYLQGNRLQLAFQHNVHIAVGPRLDFCHASCLRLGNSLRQHTGSRIAVGRRLVARNASRLWLGNSLRQRTCRVHYVNPYRKPIARQHLEQYTDAR